MIGPRTLDDDDATTVSPRPEGDRAADDAAPGHAASRRAVVRYLRVLGCDVDEVDDLAQEVLLRWWRSGGPARPERTSAWLFRVTKNVFIDRHRRRQGPRLESWTECIEEAVAAKWAPDGGDAWVDAAQQCAAGLPERTARLVQLFYVEGRSREEIARELGMRPNGVKTGLQRARAALRQCIEARLR